KALAARKRVTHQWVRLEALELLERAQVGIRIIEVDHKADRHQVVAKMIEKRSAARVLVERPAKRVLHQAWPVLLWRNFPELLEPDPILLRLAVLLEAKALEQYLGQAAARAFGEERVFRPQLDAAREGILRAAVLANTHVTGGNASDRALRRVEHFGCSKARKYLDAQRLRLGGEPAAHIPERHDEVAVVAHQRRHEDIGQPDRAGGTQHVKAIRADRGLDRGFLAAPAWKQPIEPDRINHRA